MSKYFVCIFCLIYFLLVPIEPVTARDCSLPSVDARGLILCDEKLLEISQVMALAQTMHISLEMQVSSVVHDPAVNEENRLFARQVMRKLRCIKRKMNSLELNCFDLDKCENSYALHLGGNSINLCPNFWEHSERMRGASYLHELSHSCLTDDIVYHSEFEGAPTSAPERIYGDHKKLRGHRNADSYEYWALYGFCLPPDCPKQ
jgi:hypothetical protein